MAYTKYSLTPANNNATPPDGAPEGMLPSAVNDTMRDMMAQIRDVGDGIRDGTYTMTAPKITGGTITGVTFSGTEVSATNLTSGRVVYAGTSGKLQDDADFTFNGTTVTMANDASISGLTVGKGAGSVSSNTTLGNSSLLSNTTGQYNTAIGQESFRQNTTGVSNTGVGYQAGYLTTTGSRNSAFGTAALPNNTTASDNTAVGYFSLLQNTTGANNTSVGSGALAANTTASNNTAVGYQAGYSNTTADENVAVGALAMTSTTTGNAQVAVGRSALRDNTTGSENTAVGRTTLSANTTGNLNSGFGRGVLQNNTTGSYNTGSGAFALFSNTTASNNTAVGYQAGYTNSTGYNNIALGYQSLYSNTTGYENNATGVVTLYANTTGAFNSSYGNASLRYNTTGNYNTAMGVNALYSNTTASNNTAVGYQALYANTTGTSNTAIGYWAGKSTTVGTQSTFLGAYAGQDTTGTYNTFVGYGAGYLITTGTKNTVLGQYNGNQGGLDIRTASNYIVLSDGDGVPWFNINAATGQLFLKQTSANTHWKALKESYMGYSNTYGALVVGSTDQNQTICLNIDPSTIVGGGFSGDGTEILLRRAGRFEIPNAGATDFQSLLSWSGQSVTIAGSLSKGSGSFRIDHPLPELEATHQLVHSFIEGPQADLIYRGVVDLVNGKATVNIDTSAGMTEGTFEALCREVQCFTTNESDWVAVRGKVIGNILTIEAQDVTATSTISWMVIGERKDKHMMDTEWTDENGKVVVEPLKQIIETASQKEIVSKHNLINKE